MQSVGDILKELRKYKGWNQADLARFSGVSLDSIKGYESKSKNQKNITIHTLEKLANAFELNIVDFYNYKLSSNMSSNQKKCQAMSQIFVKQSKKMSSNQKTQDTAGISMDKLSNGSIKVNGDGNIALSGNNNSVSNTNKKYSDKVEEFLELYSVYGNISLDHMLDPIIEKLYKIKQISDN